MHGKISAVKLLDAVIVTGAGEAHEPWSDGSAKNKTFTASGTTSAGAGAASIDIEASNDNSNWNAIGTIPLVLATTSSMDGFSNTQAFRYFRANVISISGTNATVTVRLAN